MMTEMLLLIKQLPLLLLKAACTTSSRLHTVQLMGHIYCMNSYNNPSKAITLLVEDSSQNQIPVVVVISQLIRWYWSRVLFVCVLRTSWASCGPAGTRRRQLRDSWKQQNPSTFDTWRRWSWSSDWQIYESLFTGLPSVKSFMRLTVVVVFLM